MVEHALDGGQGAAHSLTNVLDRLANEDEEKSGGNTQVSVEDVHQALGDKSFGPLIMVPALIEISPLGGIPGVPTFLALVIVFVSAQILFGREHVWLPGFIGNRSVKASRMEKAVDWLRKPARWLDKAFHGRMKRLTRPPFDKIVAAACILLMLTVPPLEFLPFASTLPMAAVAILGLALLTDDGLLVAIGLVAAAAALAGGIYWAVTSLGGGGSSALLSPLVVAGLVPVVRGSKDIGGDGGTRPPSA